MKHLNNGRGGLNPEKMLTRATFSTAVLARDKGRCIFCGGVAIEAHHILDRKLWPQRDGYFLSNGASVCEADHWKCEITEYSVEQVRAAVGILKPALPPGFDENEQYDKWGNRLLPDGRREAGPLFDDDGAQKALAKGRHLWRFAP